MKKLFLLSIFLNCFLWAIAQKQERKNCKKSFMLKGVDINGRKREVILTTTKRFYDFTQQELGLQNIDDKKRYDGYPYTKIGEPSQQQDCAGYVFEKLFHKGKYWVTGEVFYKLIVKNFGKKINNEFTWGDVKVGDVVIYINDLDVGNHIAIVKEVITTGSVATTVKIETKDGTQGVFLHTLPNLTSLSNDPLITIMGKPSIFRIDASAIEVTPFSKGECDSASPFKNWIGVWYNRDDPYKLTIKDNGGGILSCSYDSVPVKRTSSGQYADRDPKLITGCLLNKDTLYCNWVSDPENFDAMRNRKTKRFGVIKMCLSYYKFTSEWFLSWIATIETPDCKGCIQSPIFQKNIRFSDKD